VQIALDEFQHQRRGDPPPVLRFSRTLILVDPSAFPAQQDVEPEVAVAPPALGQVANAHLQRCLIRLGGAVADADRSSPSAAQ
jgi:hypothetical protein